MTQSRSPSDTRLRDCVPGGAGGECVETATLGAAVAVRDTKDNGEGPVLRFTPNAWQPETRPAALAHLMTLPGQAADDGRQSSASRRPQQVSGQSTPILARGAGLANGRGTQ